MDWTAELTRFALHAAVAAAVVAFLLGPAKGWTARLVTRVGAMSRGRAVALAVALTLATRLVLLPAVHPIYEADIKEYCEKAAAIATDGHPRAEETRADGSRFYRTLGYSLPLAGWYRVTGMPETPEGRVRSAQAFNLAAACGVAWLLVALGAGVFRETAGRVAALAYATFLPAMMFSLLPYTETWTTLLVVASALVFERLRDAQSTRVITMAGAFCLLQGLLLITRIEFAWMPVLALVVLVRERSFWGAVVPALFGIPLLVLPFVVNHEMRDGYPGHLRTSVQGGLILYFGNNPIEVNGYGNATPEVAAHVRKLYAEDPTGGSARAEALDWMKEHPLAVLGNAPKKLYHLWLAEPQGFGWHVGAGRELGTDRVLAALLRHAAWVQSLCLLLLALPGFVRGGALPRFWIAVLVLHAATWCVLASSTRNRYPLEPFLMIAAVAWLQTRWRKAANA